MTIHFHLPYLTDYGQQLVLNILPTTDADAAETAVAMTTTDGREWKALLDVDNSTARLDYYYTVERGEQTERTEWKTVAHRLDLTAAKGHTYVVFDRWLDIPEDSYLYSSAFTDCINGLQPETPRKSGYARTVRLKVRAPQLQKGQRLSVTGRGAALGNWTPDGGVEMTQHNYNEWVADLDAAAFTDGVLEFKFVAGGQLWETCANRILHLPPLHTGDVAVFELDQSFYAMPNRHFAGTLIPVFSLRSEGSFGVGDFGDLRRMIDFVSATGQRVLQVLPINDTTLTHTFTDSYPYSCISIFALHPQYADLRQLPPLADEAQNARFEALQKELNALPAIDYERVNAAKTEYLHLCYKQNGRGTLQTAAYKRFFAENKEWLEPYACYCVLREHYGMADFNCWPERYRRWTSELKASVTKLGDIKFYYYIQYLLDAQLTRVHEYAREKGVVLKGDIPIGVNRGGCDVWMEPHYFNLNGQAGAPPDDFSADGQNWGFPTYNWEAMLADGCHWWVRRFQNMRKYFDAYRIDHVLGFFRIWEIPISAVGGLTGQFAPALGLSREEMERYGFYFNEEHHAQPYITTWALHYTFGEEAERITKAYLDHNGADCWRLKPHCDTERKIVALDIPEDEKAALQAFCADLLFVKDRKEKDLYHPRIGAQKTFAFRALADDQKTAFNRLYDDYFYHRNEQFWAQEAYKKLPRLAMATRMLICAEDLGMVPGCVKGVMNALRILSLEIQSMPKQPGLRFAHLPDNPYRSVATISTHDMPTLRQWWDEDEDRTQDYFNGMLRRQGLAPHPLTGDVARDILYRHLTSPSLLCIISLQDWLAMDEQRRRTDADAERINVPANPKHYWRYRMHLTLDQMLTDNALIKEISELVKQSGRS